MDILIGCDPELFVSKEGKAVSAHGLIPGTKKEPFKVKKGAVQVDGMALEFNIDPADTFRKFSGSITAVLAQLRSMVPEDMEFQVTPVAYFDEDYIKGQPDEATELGCEPDYNAWTGQVNPTPDASQPFRTASGHIHIGWTEGMDIRDPDHIEACQMMVKQLDCVLAPISLMWDKDHTRRKLYGMPGAYRPKPYGVEYRVLSNAWIKDTLYRKVVWAAVKYSFNMLLEGDRVYEYMKEMTELTCVFGTKGEEYHSLRLITRVRDMLSRLYYHKLISKQELSAMRKLLDKNSKEIRKVFDGHNV